MHDAYQPIEQRLLFIYATLTGKSMDRGSTVWQHLISLKKTRDGYIHRIGKGASIGFLDKSVLLNGFNAVRTIVAQLFQQTPEFQSRFIYEFLAFWSCKTELPFLWDSADPGVFYLGLLEFDPKKVVSLFAPQRSTFSNLKEMELKGEA
jgi:hypothetical protein